MSVDANQVNIRYNFFAALFAWLTLAGFITLPNTFTSLQDSSVLGASKSGQLVQSAVRNVGLLPFAGTLCSIGIGGICYLWQKHRSNYIWLLRHLFL